MTASDPMAGERQHCDTCADTGRIPWMIEGDPNCYQEPDSEGTLPCPECVPASPPAVAASTGTSEDVEALAKLLCATDPTSNEDTWLVVREGHREYRRDHAAAILASDWLAAHDAATADRVRRETAEAQRCGGCKGQGSHRRHCPRHPSYHPWIPLADLAARIGDSIGEPGLANRAWALAGLIREEMPNHPYRSRGGR